MFKVAAACDRLWSGEMLGCRVGGVPVLLVNLGDRVAAYRDQCAHLGVALSEGELREGRITCRAHAWQYEAATGQGVNPASVALVKLPVRIENGVILVDTAPAEPA